MAWMDLGVVMELGELQVSPDFATALALDHLGPSAKTSIHLVILLEASLVAKAP